MKMNGSIHWFIPVPCILATIIPTIKHGVCYENIPSIRVKMLNQGISRAIPVGIFWQVRVNKYGCGLDNLPSQLIFVKNQN
jgi:hypothetical protein